MRITRFAIRERRNYFSSSWHFRVEMIRQPSTARTTGELLEYAVAYRNLIAHECTYVGDDKSPSMIQACKEILMQLASIAGVDDFDPDL